MSQETANSVISTNEQDVREYTYKTANDSVQYSSENIMTKYQCNNDDDNCQSNS